MSSGHGSRLPYQGKEEPTDFVFHINKVWNGIIILHLPVWFKRSEWLGSEFISSWVRRDRESITNLAGRQSDSVIFYELDVWYLYNFICVYYWDSDRRMYMGVREDYPELEIPLH